MKFKSKTVRFALLIWATLGTHNLLAQTSLPLTNIIPPSPDVSALQKYGDIQVSPYTGIPDITVPLYTVKFHDINFPISVSYHASGIKVAEDASQVGLGWALNAGGVISRKVVNFDDFQPLVYFNGTGLSVPDLTSYYKPSPGITSGTIINPGYVNNVDVTDDLNAVPNVDFQPDEFYYNLPGANGKFMLTRNYKAILQKQEKMDITCGTNASGVIDGSVWKITNVDGFIYDFKQAEYYEDPNGPLIPHYSAVYLTQITSPTGAIVTFHYVPNGAVKNYVQPPGNFIEFRDDGIPPLIGTNYLPHSLDNIRKEGTGELYTGYSLSYIDYNEGRVQFSYTNDRIDVTGANQLNTITVYSKDSQGNLSSSPLKTINFSYGYFDGPVGPSASHYSSANVNDTTAPNYEYRLKLNSITESGIYNGQTITANPYIFTYNTGGTNTLPSKDSFQCDHWGYYNGMYTNTSFIPSFTRIGSINSVSGWFGIPDNSRGANGLYMQAFSLSDIKYPTGGTTHFDYEANDCDEQKSLVNDQSGNPYPYTILPGKLSPYNLSWYVGSAQPANLDMSDEYQGPDGIVSTTLNLTFRLNGSQPTNFSINSLHSGVAYLNMINIVNGASYMFDPFIYQSYTTVSPQGIINIVMPFSVPPGIYQMKCYVNPSASDYGQYVVNMIGQVSWLTQVNSNPAPGVTYPTTYSQAGGLRILRITNNDGFNPPQIKKFNYHYTSGGLTYSYGRTMSRPQYSYWEQSVDLWIVKTGSGNAQTLFWPEHIIRASTSNIPLNGSASGAVVGYDQVAVSYGENGENGMTVYKYHNNPDIVMPYLSATSNEQNLGTSSLSRRRPYASNIADPLNGSLLEQTDYRNSGGQFSMVKDVINNYTNNTTYENDYYAFEDHIQPHFIVTTDDTPQGGGASSTTTTFTPATPTDRLLYTYSSIQSVWICPTSIEEKNYSSDDPTKYSDILTSYYYDNPIHYLPTRTVTTNSKGQVTTNTTTYPLDYTPLSTTDSISLGIKNLINTHVYNVPIEEKIQKTDITESNPQYISSRLMIYSSTIPLVSQVYQMQSVAPLATFANLTIGNPTLAGLDSAYKPVISFNYDSSNGDLIQQAKNLDINNSYQWGYNKTYPVASVSNAKSNDIFYDSFEEGNGTSSICKTGHYGFSGTYSKTLNNLDAGNYILSYWLLSNGTWSLVSTPVPVTGSSCPITINGQIDDVRFYPQNAQMTTYTYDPLIGITSTTDEKGKIIYYEYDAFQRLKNIKDQYGNIIKNYSYHYQGQ